MTYDGSGSFDPDGTIVAYNWIFGDGETATGRLVNHTFQKRGTYRVQLTVVDNSSETGQIVQSIEVKGLFAPLNVAWHSFTDESLFMTRTVADITWTANPDNDAIAAIAKYRIYRKKAGDEDGAFNAYVEVSGSTFKYRDVKVTAANEYVYAVTAIDGQGHESPLSGTANSVNPIRSIHGAGKLKTQAARQPARR